MTFAEAARGNLRCKPGATHLWLCLTERPKSPLPRHSTKPCNSGRSWTAAHWDGCFRASYNERRNVLLGRGAESFPMSPRGRMRLAACGEAVEKPPFLIRPESGFDGTSGGTATGRARSGPRSHTGSATWQRPGPTERPEGQRLRARKCGWHPRSSLPLSSPRWRSRSRRQSRQQTKVARHPRGWVREIAVKDPAYSSRKDRIIWSLKGLTR
jgi:hypothetical protein